MTINVETIIAWVVLGFVAGYIIHLLDRRAVPGGIVATTITGIIGAVIGGLLGSLFFGVTVTGLNVPSIIIAVIGGLILSLLQRLTFGPQQTYNFAQMGHKGGEAGQIFQGTLVNPVQVQKFIEDVDYPAAKDILIKKAQDEGADDNVIYTLSLLPDMEYEGSDQVSEELGKLE